MLKIPSKIFKSDLAIWENKTTFLQRWILRENHYRVREIILKEGKSLEIKIAKNTTVLLLPLFGEVIVNQFINSVYAGCSLTIKNQKNIQINNLLKDIKSDILMIELPSDSLGKSFIINDLDFSQLNKLIPISKVIKQQNFIGIFEGRIEREILLSEGKSYIFGMVINGAFEFQNRLLETRDAVILSEMEILEFESLGNNSLLLFLEI